MNNILMLIQANLRKHKSQSLSMFVFVLLAAMFLSVGLTIYFGLTGFFDERVRETNTEHFSTIFSESGGFADEQFRYIKNYPGVTETGVQKAIGGEGGYTLNGEKNIAYMYFARSDGAQSLGAPSLIGRALPLTGDAVYIPYFMQISGGYNIGDKFTVNLSGKNLSFTVAGVTEELMFGAQMNKMYRFFISDEKYARLLKELPNAGYTLIMARFENTALAESLAADFSKDVPLNGLAFTVTVSVAKMGRTTVSVLVSVIISALAVILLIVTLIVIRFRITNSIEESMTNIGALKSVGFRNRQIVLSIVGQFTLIASAGAAAGILLSCAAAPIIADALKPIFALDWKPKFDFLSAALPFLLVLSAIVATAFFSARQINRLHPLIALRGGLTAHNFKKNRFPLDKAMGGVNILLAYKQLFQNKKQAFTISVIVAAVTLACVACIAINYNMNDERDNFVRAIMGEIPEVNFTLKEGQDAEAFKQSIKERPDVRKAFGYYSPKNILVEDYIVLASVVEDCSLMESQMLISGRYPKHSNEIALGPAALKACGKKIGDMVKIKNGATEKDYFVTGAVQYINNGGFNGIITAAGIKEIYPDFLINSYNVYLYDRSGAAGFIENVKENYGDVFDKIMNVSVEITSTFSGMADVFATVAAACVAVTAFVVTLTLYIVIKTVILRRRREFGIQKAVGFTSFQLMNQIALGLMPPITIGALAGAFVGYFGFNPMLTMMLGGMGIVKTHLPAPLSQTVLVCAGLILSAYAASMLIAWKIRDISAYALVSE